MSKRASPLIALVPTMLLAGCVTAPFNGCPPLANYTHEELKQAQLEFAAMPDGFVTRRMIIDYQVLRDQVRACR